MSRWALGTALLVAVLAGCSSGPGTTTATILTPTTRVPAPIAPPGVADTVRGWTTQLAQGSDAAYDLLGPRSAAAVGGREGYPGVQAQLQALWARWGKVRATYDALPLGDRSGVVVVHILQKDGSERAAAVPVTSDGARWLVEPLLGTGTYRVTPADRSKIASLPDLTVEVDAGVSVQAFVDEQPARVETGEPTGKGNDRFLYRPRIGLQPGWHLVTFVFTRGSDIAAGTVRYRVPAPK
jgi:hypothetical protein